MNNFPGRGLGRRSPRLRRTRVAVVITAAAALLAACGTSSGGSPNAGGSTVSSKAVAYTQCMRSHSVPDYPDPGSNGQLAKETPQQLGISNSVFQSAQGACLSLWPYQAPAPTQQGQELTDALKFAQCMRSDGVPDWPDPTTDSGSGRVEFVISLSKDGINLKSPQITAKARVCERGVPASMLPGSPTGVKVTQAP